MLKNTERVAVLSALIPCLVVFFFACKGEPKSYGKSGGKGTVSTSSITSSTLSRASTVPKTETGPVNQSSLTVAPGMLAPEFKLRALSGGSRSLKDYRGNLVLLNFWASWCIPCVKEMPGLERLYQALQDKGLIVLGVSIDKGADIEAARLLVEKNSISFPVILDSKRKIAAKYGLTGIPESFFIGPDGKFVAFLDPYSNKEIVRVVSDRAWDSTRYLDTVEKLLQDSIG